MDTNRRIFFLNGVRSHWQIARTRSIWGLPQHRNRWEEVLAELQQAGFAAGAEILGIAGPYACLRAVVGSDRGVFRDDTTAPFGMDASNDIYPVRFELTKIEEINRPWYRQTQGEEFRSVLEERYFTEKCLYVLSTGAARDQWIDREVVYGGDTPASTTPPPPAAGGFVVIQEPDALEDRTAELFANIGFRVEQLGHRRPYERVPDGVASLAKSLSEHLKRMNEEPYFILWDSKFDCGARGLTADEERAIREYVTDFAQRTKLNLATPGFWFLVVARDVEVAARIQSSIDRATWPDDLHEQGCKGLRTVSIDWLASIASKASDNRRSGGDPDQFLAHEFPQLVRKARSR